MAIVGMGAVFPGAGDVGAFWRNIVAGVDATGEVPVSRWDPATFYDPEAYHRPPVADRFYCRRGGFVDDVASFDPTRFGIMPAVVASTDPDQLLALRAAAEAIEDAGGVDALPDRARIGVIIGRGGYLTPGMARLDQRVRTVTQLLSTLRELVPGLSGGQLANVREQFLTALGPASPDAAIGLVPNFAAARLANRFDLRGPSYTIDAACASGLLAVDAAVRELTSGRCDAVLAGAVHVCHDPTLWSVFTQLRALSPSERIRPFDRRADGTLMAEGTGVVVLKRYADAIRAGDRVYAVVRGVGVASDGRAASLVSPSADGQVLAVQRAWAAAGLDPATPDAVGLIEAHGTATPVGDSVELTTLSRVFGTDGPPIGVGTVKSMIGHAMPAAGMAGLIKAALAVHHGILPPTLHVDEPHPAFQNTRCRPQTETTPWPSDTPRRAGVNAFGFGGINAHIVLEAVASSAAIPPASVPAGTGLGTGFGGAGAGAGAGASGGGGRNAVRSGSAIGAGNAGTGSAEEASDAVETLLLFAADSRENLFAQLAVTDAELLARAAAFSRGEFGFESHPSSPHQATTGSGVCRLAIVAPTPRRLALARKVVERGRPWRGREDIWFTTEPLLVGDGTLAFLFPGFEPEFAPRVADVARHFGLPGPRLTGGGELHSRGADVVAVGRFLAEALGELGVVPDLVSGHSLGEWTAMVAAGSYRADAVDKFVDSLRPGTVAVPEVDYAAVGCGAERALAIATDQVSEHVAEPRGPAVVISHDNCPHQSVLCGPPDAIAAGLERLRAAGVPGEVLAFRSGFHTPMATPYLAEVRASFEVLPLDPPHTPVWSATTLAPYPDEPGEVRELLVRHLLEPVRFRQLLERLHDTGVRGFVQVGPGSLTGFVADTLGRRDHLAIAAHVPARGGLAQLRRVAAALWVEGRSPRWNRLPTASTTAITAIAGNRAANGAAVLPNGAAIRANEAESAAKQSSATAGITGALFQLALGAPAVRLAGLVEPLIPATFSGQTGPAVTLPPTDNPVLAALAATLTEATAAAQAVTEAWSVTGPARGLSPVIPARGPAPQPSASAHPARSPLSPTVLPRQSVPSRSALSRQSLPSPPALSPIFPPSPASPPVLPRPPLPALSRPSPPARPLPGSGGPGLVRTVECSLTAMPWLSDHSLIPQADGWPDPSDRFPVVPMTGLLEMMADAARELSPDRVVIGLEQVRVRRWLVVAPPTTATIRAVAESRDRVKITIAGYASGTVLLAAAYPVPPQVDDGPLRDERPAPVDALRLYADNWMFHGPEFAGVTSLDTLAADGIRGELTARPAPGALLDAAGQLIGHWMQVSADVDQVVFPIGIETVRWFGPPPEPGERLHCTARITELTADRMRADAQLVGGDGRVRVTITDWATHRFSTDDRMWQLKQHPGEIGAGEPQPDGWCLVRERWPDTATRELVMRRYLVAAERAEYADRTPMAQREWLLGRVAAKDAVRELLRTGDPLFPCQIRIGNDADGRPWARGPGGERFHVSLAHAGPIAVAVASAADGVGIDVEAVAERDIAAVALTEMESRLVRDAAPADRAELVTRLWTAKEAAAKAAGTGLDGGPRRFAVTGLTAHGCAVEKDGRRWTVRHRVIEGPGGRYVVAWTTEPLIQGGTA
ncbi:type I polyketide synthase [Actinoplanes derwentensis]|uniref:type I polyketide synthase n=1 Tax=Actinoplanes derwentensis TaxID=113562 RepID=UPI0018D2C5DD|nr:type I polyketide synthase [Actinoplanes derwentensis]